MQSVPTTPSPSRQHRTNYQQDTPPVFLAPAGYNYRRYDGIGQDGYQRRATTATTVPADSSPDGSDPRLRQCARASNTGSSKRSYDYGQPARDNNGCIQGRALPRQYRHGQDQPDEVTMVPHEVSVVPQHPFSNGSSPLYATNKSLVLRSLFPSSAATNRPPFLSALEPAWSSSPADLVLHRLVAICFECRMHSIQLVGSAMHDLAQYITRQPVNVSGAAADEMEVLLDKWMTRLSIAQAVVHVMTSHSRHARFQFDACRILYHLGKLTFAVSPQQCMSTTESVRAILECLQHHVDDKELVQTALAALIHMGAHFPYHEALFGNDALKFLVRDILRKHLDCAEIQVEILFLLGNLCCNMTLADGIVHAGGVSAIVESMNIHWQNSKASEGGVLALFKLSKWSSARKRMVIEHGGYAAVFRVSKTHSEGRVGNIARATLDVLT